MGAWDITVFGNDDAADYLFEFDDADTTEKVLALLRQAMDAVLSQNEYVESSVGAEGLAAAALVAAWKSPDLLGSFLQEELAPWPRTEDPLGEEIQRQAAKTFERMQKPANNELSDLWQEAEMLQEFNAELNRWRIALP